MVNESACNISPRGLSLIEALGVGVVRHPCGHNKRVAESGVSGAEASYNRVLFAAGALGRGAGMTYTIITKMALISGFIRPH